MRKILAILVVTGLLALALPVPALAGASNPPSAFGQFVAWATTQFPGDPFGEGVEYKNVGQHVSANVHELTVEGKTYGAQIQSMKDDISAP